MSHVRTWNIAKVKYAELFVLDSCMLTVVLWSMARALCNRSFYYALNEEAYWCVCIDIWMTKQSRI